MKPSAISLAEEPARVLVETSAGSVEYPHFGAWRDQQQCGHSRLMTDEVTWNVDPETVTQALRRLNGFHRALFWAEKYHELSYREIADRLRIPEELVVREMRIMIARFVLAAELVESGRPEGMFAKSKRLVGSLTWTLKLRLWASRADYLSHRRKASKNGDR